MKKIKRTLQTIFFAAACYTFSACGSATDVTYLQDLHPNVMIELQKVQEIKLQPGDKLSIVVHSRDNELAQMFNLSSYNTESAKVSSNSSNSYTIDNQGNIDVPNLGLINTIGLTRLELANKIKQELLSQELLKDPVVTVEFTNLSYSIIGEVGSPGRKEFTRDQLTLLEAIAEAGDLTINGRRDNILVLRTDNGIQKPYRVDLTEINSLYASPAYYLKQNDFIYVEPNQMKANQSKQNAGTFRTPTFWMSLASFITSLVMIFTR